MNSVRSSFFSTLHHPNKHLFMPENYRALTRTYRPQNFEDIVSQEHVSNTLQNAIRQERISHAYMFCGPRGVGKTTMARVLARTINSIDADVDGESLNQTLNVVEIDAASNNKVDDIHHLRESVRIPPQNGRYKVFIVDEVHMLSKAAFNALLKTLEEPPAHAIFIFATTEPHKVLPTILSRVQRFDFKRISVDEIVSRLKNICRKEEITIDEESLHVIAKKADGALRDALGLMDQAIAFCGNDIQYDELIRALNVVGSDQLFEFMQAVVLKDSGKGLKLVDHLIKSGVDIQEFLAALTEHLRNLYVATQSERMHLVDATQDTKNRFIEAAKDFTEEDLMRMLHLVSEAQMKIRDVQQPRVHFEILLLKLVHMNRSRELNQLINQLRDVKKNGKIEVDAAVNGSEPEQKATARADKEKTPANDDDDESDKITGNVVVNEPVPGNETGGGSAATGASEEDYSEEKIHSAEEKPKSRNGGDGKSGAGKNGASVQSPHQKEPESLRTLSKAEESLKPEENDRTQPSGKSSEPEEDPDDYLMIKPALGFAKGISSRQGVMKPREDVEVAVEEEYPQPVKLNSVDDLQPYWSDFVKQVKNSAPQLLYLQVLRVQLKDLRGMQLILTADNEFATNQFDENQELLSDLMKRVVGTRLRLKCIVERNEKKKETLSPYERFKELQKKDPQLKHVVELFGAELDY